MRKINIKKLFLLLMTGLFSTIYTFATNINEDKEPEIKMLKSFYTKYITNMLEDKNEENSEVMKQYFLPELIVEIDEMTDYSDVDNVVRAQDVSDKMISTLEITPLEKDWYMVSYVWNRKVEIPLKTTKRDGKYMIEYIVPECMGRQYGNHLLPDVIMLTDFYKKYVGNGIDGNVKENKNLTNRYLSYELCTKHRKMMVNFGDDILLNSEKFSQDIINTLNVKKTGDNSYIVCFKSTKDVSINIRMSFMANKWYISEVE